MNLYVSNPPRPSKKVTGLYTFLLLLIFSILWCVWYIFGLRKGVHGTLAWIVNSILLCSTLFVLATSIIPYRIRYEIDEEGITIKGLPWRKKIPFKELKKVSLINGSEAARIVGIKIIAISYPGCLRYGLFTGKLGKVKVYATIFKSKALLLETEKGEKIIISPKDPETFKQKLDAHLKHR